MNNYFLFFILSFSLQASTARIMTYNLWNFDGEDNSREDDIQMVISEINPDIIVAEELDGDDGFDALGTDILDQIEDGLYTGAPFTNQSNTNVDIGLYYKPDVFEFISTATINTTSNWGHRDAIEFVMQHISSGVEIRLYGVHLKAGTGNDDEAERAEEASALREYLNGLDSDDFIFVLGDFNLYNSGEDAWAALTESQTENNGRLFDPIDEVGNWHNNSAFEEVHTQSPRAFYNGANFGGMDDRFDFILTSFAVLDTASSDCYYEENSYTPFGNDGNHFNQAVNDGYNSAVSDDVADALVVSSDHLPVYLDVWFDDLVYNDEGIVITEIMPNPSSVSDSYGEWFEIHNATDETIDIQGWTIKDLDNDEHVITSDAMSVLVNPGQFFVLIDNADPSTNGGVIADYEYGGMYIGNSADEIILTDETGAIVDEVQYTNSWPFASGVSMEIHDVDANNFLEGNWFEATLAYGDGDYGTPGTNYDGTVNVVDELAIPGHFRLFPPYPNPFNPTTTIRFNISAEAPYIVSIDVFDLTGRLVETLVEGFSESGFHEIKWNAENYASGVYYFKLDWGSQSQIQKAVLIK